MALKPRTVLPGEKLTFHSMGEPLPQAHYQRCPQCDTLFMLPVVKNYQSAYCPRCDAKLRDGRDWSTTKNSFFRQRVIAT